MAKTDRKQEVSRGSELRSLDVFIGRWINKGETVDGAIGPGEEIFTSDVYEWAPGGFFVLHSAYGRIGEMDVGGIEVIGFDPTSRTYRSHFFDSEGNVSVHELSVRDGVWRWQGERTRATATFSDDGKTQTVHHERSEDSGRWAPSMEVVLRKVV
jgi:hypothetical protein